MNDDEIDLLKEKRVRADINVCPNLFLWIILLDRYPSYP